MHRENLYKFNQLQDGKNGRESGYKPKYLEILEIEIKKR